MGDSLTVDGTDEDLALSKSEFLGRQEVIRRRLRRVKQLSRLYKAHYWSLMEELKRKHKEYYWIYGKSPFKEDDKDENKNLGLGFLLKCQTSDCKGKAMALTRFCHKHILKDPNQTLYRGCSYPVKSGQICKKPILRSINPPHCPIHAQAAEKHLARALKRAGLNVSSPSKLAPKLHVVVAEVRHWIFALKIIISSYHCTGAELSFHGGLRPFTPFQKDFQVRCNAQDKSVLGMSNGNLHRMSFKPQAVEPFYSSFAETTEQPVPMDLINSYSCPDKLNDVKCDISNVSNPSGEKLVDLIKQSVENVNGSTGTVGSETMSTTDTMVENPIAFPSTLDFDNNSPSSVTNSLDDFLNGVNESFSSSVNKGENAVKSLLDKITSSVTSVTTSASEAVDNTQALANTKVSNLSSDLNEAASKVNAFVVDLLRRTIVIVEDSLSYGASSCGYYYGSAKERLPPEIKDALTLYEERTGKALKPVGAALQQVYTGIEGVERSLGFDPNDPIVPVILLFGTSATLWAFYWVWAYSGYSGDLSPKLTLELLSGKENALLIDVRPEARDYKLVGTIGLLLCINFVKVLRERDGIPDLRRVARFRYACVSLPEVEGSMSKLLKSGRDLEDSLIAVVIRNLKTIEDRSKVIIMDADGSRSKGIARSLRKLGVKRPYLVQGGFQSWVQQSVRVKELKPETTLSILNEEAEAILEDISPSPLQSAWVWCGKTLVPSVKQWEKSLQLIGILGLVLTIYRQVSSYENSEDLEKDLRLLLVPVRVGAQAYSWIAGKLGSNGIGLPTSPSPLDVQNRVLQAAAKLESLPSNAEDPSADTLLQ
ncbi:hypothetical protein V6N13_064486 [Hibiscus sabdariffa]